MVAFLKIPLDPSGGLLHRLSEDCSLTLLSSASCLRAGVAEDSLDKIQAYVPQGGCFSSSAHFSPEGHDGAVSGAESTNLVISFLGHRGQVVEATVVNGKSDVTFTFILKSFRTIDHEVKLFGDL